MKKEDIKELAEKGKQHLKAKRTAGSSKVKALSKMCK